jgi:hypothetical protein
MLLDIRMEIHICEGESFAPFGCRRPNIDCEIGVEPILGDDVSIALCMSDESSRGISEKGYVLS